MTKKKSATKNSGPVTDALNPVYVMQYKITDEPMQDRSFRQLPQFVKERLEELYQEAQRRPLQAIPELRMLNKKYPQIPQIYNYLAVAYSRMGETKKAEAMTLKNMRRNPDYLFARLNYAEFCLARGEYEKIPEILGHKYDLQLLYPKRKRFHVSEVANFMGIVGLYFAKTNQGELAEKYNEILQELDPDILIAKRLNRELNPGFLTRLSRRLSGK
jgi:tetratricopeptide (TPR) repeat protein